MQTPSRGRGFFGAQVVTWATSGRRRARVSWVVAARRERRRAVPDVHSARSRRGLRRTLDLTLKPGPLALAPSWLLTEYGDAIAAGAIARLKRHARKLYTDYDGAEFAAKEWRRGVARAAQAGAARLAGIDSTGVVPAATEWTVGEGTVLRAIAGDSPTYADLVKAVRTLIEDLQTRGVI